MVSACLEAYRLTSEDRWRVEARRAFDWFLGQNDVKLPIYDASSGGCRDALHPDRTSANQGAEATIAFLLARYGFGDRAMGIVRRHARLKAISDEFRAEGWKIVLVTRLVPFFPFKLSNYAFGLTKIPLRGFVGGTLIGEIPLSVHNVYLGSIAADLATLGQRQTERTPLEWALYGIGFAVAMISVLYLGLWAKRVLSTYHHASHMRSDDDALA